MQRVLLGRVDHVMEQPGNASGELGTRAVCGPARGLRPGTGGATGAPRPRPRPGLMGGRGPCPRCSALVRPSVFSLPLAVRVFVCVLFLLQYLQNIQTAHTTQEQKNHRIKNWTEDLNSHFSREDRHVASGHLERPPLMRTGLPAVSQR